MSMFFQLFALFAALFVVTVTAGPQCSRAYGPRYGYISYGKKHSYGAGSVVAFKCNRGYKLIGRNTIRCISRGSSVYWNSKIPICKKQVIVIGKSIIMTTL